MGGGYSQAGCDRSFDGIRTLVVGLGRFGGGVGATRWLVEQGATVAVSDASPAESLADSIRAVAGLGVEVHAGGHDPRHLDSTDLAIINPAVEKRRSRFFQEIVRRGIPWTTELNLFCERCPATVIGVTGTYGKSTVCSMLSGALRVWIDRCGRSGRVYLGGNIGRSLLMELRAIRSDDVVVLEMSNAQLEDLPRIDWAPQIAVITNLHPHHLDRYSAGALDCGPDVAFNRGPDAARDGCSDSSVDRHAAAEAYFDAKLNIARDPSHKSRIIVGDLDPTAAAFFHPWSARLTDGERRVHFIRPANPPVKLNVPGRHNQAAASCVLEILRCLHRTDRTRPHSAPRTQPRSVPQPHACPEPRASARADVRRDRRTGARTDAPADEPHVGAGEHLDEAAIRTALSDFEGLPHRLQHVRALGGVDYYNDSKATSPAGTIVAVESFDRPIVAIVGGKDKGASLTDCAEALIRGCRAVICTGESGPNFAKALQSAGKAGSAHRSPGRSDSVPHLSTVDEPHGAHGAELPGNVIVHQAATLDEAVHMAYAEAKPGDIVLFAPGAPSFDAYTNFIERGDHFVRLLRGI